MHPPHNADLAATQSVQRSRAAPLYRLCSVFRLPSSVFRLPFSAFRLRLMRPFALLLLATSISAQTPLDLSRSSAPPWHIVNQAPRPVVDSGPTVARFDEQREGALAWTSAVDFADGDIEFDARGRDVLQGSFVGVAFRVRDDNAYDLVYLRPFNFRAADSARHAHAVQYVYVPDAGWEKLRAEHPGMYESAIVPEPKADGWVHVRLALRGADLRVYVNGATRPALALRTLSGFTHGGVGIWVGPASNGDFANLRIISTRLPGS
jgi:hypothetical protein